MDEITKVVPLSQITSKNIVAKLVAELSSLTPGGDARVVTCETVKELQLHKSRIQCAVRQLGWLSKTKYDSLSDKTGLRVYAMRVCNLKTEKYIAVYLLNV